MRIVYICSPYRAADEETLHRNIEYARELTREALLRGESPDGDIDAAIKNVQDEYDRENGYEDEEQEEQNTWKICGEIVDRVTKIAIRLMRESYGQCMKENIIELLKYLKFELETVNENT